MPLYEYECKQCHRRLEKIQSFSAPPETTCPHCQGELERVISAPAIQFKGAGWYVNDYARSGGKPAEKSEAKSDEKGSGAEKSSSESGSEGSKDSGAGAPAAASSESPSSAPAANASSSAAPATPTKSA